ncbi:MAG: hypothetical protein C3F13_09505 [Anaerolineales bacterium]|nr:hypothetical protein [Anaerolineae bacterium]PWB53369.1 MAG: hypothetical protein C3F13_09505 [Anaerolineales bacterium]
MSIIIALLSSLLTALPASVFLSITFASAGREYFWKSYLAVGVIFLAASLAIGYILPQLAPRHWKHHPSYWLFGQGLLAWSIAILLLTCFNLTPLCVGQDNGDGNNDLAICVVQTVLVSLTAAPLECILLCLFTLPGGWILKRWVTKSAL